MKEILIMANYKKVNSYIDIFKLSGIIKDNCKLTLLERQKDKTWAFSVVIYLFLTIFYSFYLLITLDMTGGNDIGSKLVFIFIGALGFIYPFMTLEKKIKKYHKKRINKVFGKLLKDSDFKNFISEYYDDIKNKKLSKKETISFVKNWKENENILAQERIDIEIEGLTEIISTSEKALKEAKEKLKELK